MFWQNKKVLVTGHTGFKGSWLCLMLQQLNAHVIGYALPPPSNPDLFTLARVADGMTHIIGDVTDYQHLNSVIKQHQPEIVIHMAAQSLVRESYVNPVETYATNVMGTLHVFEAVRQTGGVKVLLNVTSDKCYRNLETQQAYKEDDALGGCDPYSSSKACAELLTFSYHHSFFQHTETALASVRAGNVIGGGDWAKDRIIPDMMRAYLSNDKFYIRHPHAIRPWQHVLEPLSGYLLLAEKLYQSPAEYTGSWNFGPDAADACTVGEMVNRFNKIFGGGLSWEMDTTAQPHEATYLKLDCSKAKSHLNWQPRYHLDHALSAVADWFKAYADKQDMRVITEHQINEFVRA